MWQLVKKYEKQWYALVLIAIVAIVIFIYSDREQEQSSSLTANLPLEQKNATEVKVEQKQQPTAMFVDVKGAVARPGVYEVTEYGWVKDLIAMAGGVDERSGSNKSQFSSKST